MPPLDLGISASPWGGTGGLAGHVLLAEGGGIGMFVYIKGVYIRALGVQSITCDVQVLVGGGRNVWLSICIRAI